MSDIILASVPTPELGRRISGIVHEAAVVWAGLLLLLFAAADGLLQDPDTHWHIAVGRWIWQSGGVPWTDPFSHTFAGAPWIAKEWLSQLIWFAAFSVGGWSGIVVVAAGAIASSFALLFWWLRRRIDWSAALVVTLVAVCLSVSQFTARPHVLMFPALAMWMIGLAEAAERRSPPWFLLALMAVWANLHGSFPIAIVLAALFAAEAVVRAPAPERMRTLAQWASFLVACLLVSLVSPYGYTPMVLAVKLLGKGEPLAYINEWQPLALDVIGATAVGAMLLLGGVLAFRPAANFFRILVVALLGFMMIRHGRFLSLFALAAPIAAAIPVARIFPAFAASRSGTPGFRLPTVAGLAALLVVAALPIVTAPRPATTTMPEAALRAARHEGLTGPVYNEYDFGGYLIAEGVKTFIDGRTDQLFLDGFFTAENEALKSHHSGDFDRLLARHGVTWALVRTRSSATRHLEALAWRKVYADSVAAVYARP